MQTSEWSDRDCGACAGTGSIVGDRDDEARECICIYRRRKQVFLGNDLFEAAHLSETPLVARTQDHRTLATDMTRENVWLTAQWRDLRPHLRLALGIRWHIGVAAGRSFNFRVITDEQVRLGHFADSRDEVVETVPQLLAPSADLVILRLGFLGGANKLMPGILRSALMHRIEVVRCPIWITDTPTEPFIKGHLAWSEDVARYAESEFRRVTLPRVAS